jgi:chemotaxis signal transduction protein
MTVEQADEENSLTRGADTVLTFRCKDRYFALPVSSVRYIMSEPSQGVTLHDNSFKARRVIQFSNQSIQLMHFSHLLNLTSQLEDIQEIQHTLQLRRQDHIDWLNALEQSILKGIPFTKATDPHKCAFGRWYDTFETEDDFLRDILARFDEPHKRIHASAERLLKLAAEDQKTEAMLQLKQERDTTLKRLLELFDEAYFRLQSMTRPVIVVVESGTSVFAIEMDEVSGIVECQPSDFIDNSGVSEGYDPNSIISCYVSWEGEPLHSYVEPAALLRAMGLL